MTPSSSAFYRPYGPRDPAVKSRLERFKEINRWIMARGGWVTSLPGAREVTMECLPGSSLPDELTRLGYKLVELGEGERILPAAIVWRCTQNAAGEFEPMKAGSTCALALTQAHAGICRVERYGFDFTS
jgi:hypothetical protein